MNTAVISSQTRPVIIGLIRLMRPKQWVKNGFVLAPLIFTGLFTEPAEVGKALAAMAWFCLGSSTAYIINDYFDAESDRKHPTKSKTRPIAAGLVSKPQALALLATLYLCLAIGVVLQTTVVSAIGGYMALNIAYTLVLKHQPVIDIFTIAIGFVSRVWVGALALAVPLSSWMFITTLCLALFLAAVKRRQELLRVGPAESPGTRRVLDSYSVELVDKYAQLSAIGALIFYSLFVVTTRNELVVTIPFVLFGLFRYWFIVEELEDGESPTDALFADVQLLATVFMWVCASAWAILPSVV